MKLKQPIRWLLLLVAFLGCAAALATTTMVSVIDGTAAITGSAQTITLAKPCTSIVVFTDSTAPICNINFNHGVTATSADPPIPTGGTVSVGLAIPIPPTDQINVLGAAGTGHVSWYAWTR